MRPFLKLCLGFLALSATVPATATGFGWAEVVALAERRGAEAYQPPADIPDFLRELPYEQARRFRFLPERRLWRTGNGSFQVSFIAPARHLNHPVKIHRVASDGVHEIPFERDDFDFGDPELAKRIPPDLGFVGLRLEYGRKPQDQQTLVEFSAASYFRGVGRDGVLGQWARGLAIDTGLPSGEEFPLFTRFWLEQPRPDATSLRMYALLEGPRVTGGYEFVITPGAATRIAVRAELFPREAIGMLGIAPLTSMFFYGENTARPLGQWRPEVHSSDGLLINDGNGEWLWRPLLNPRAPELYDFAVADARGFGLLQRDRRFDAYEDGDASYERRPSAWVELRKPAGSGRIVLVEIPSPDETNDNMVAFWSPRQPAAAGARLKLDYVLHFGAQPQPQQPVAAVVNTLVGRAEARGQETPDAYRFAVDFAGGPLTAIRDPDAPVMGNVTLTGGKLLEQYVEYLRAVDRWRLVFVAHPESEAGMEMRAFLHRDAQTLSETWSYHLPRANSLMP